MSNTCKNYFTDGGDTLVINGKLTIDAGATVEGVTSAPVIDTLVSVATTSALSAKQGKVLNDKVVALGPVDNLTTADATKALSANQGKALKDAADLKVATNQAANATAVATTLETAEALANALQTDFNALLVKLKAAGLMAAD